jgi:nicotinate-nucleotide--dimethylbenzimidazole phosphoribosyltransferase
MQDSATFEDRVQHAIDSKTKPVGSLGRLEELAKQLALLQNSLTPSVKKRRLLVFAASHGVTEEGISAFPAAVTGQMVRNFVAGGAAINVLARQCSAELRVIDVGVDDDLDDLRAPNFFANRVRRGTRNFTKQPAMTAVECEDALETGREQVRQAIADGIQLIGIGEMGIGNTTSAAALIAGLGLIPAENAAGAGTGLSDEVVLHKINVIKCALSIHAEPISTGPRGTLETVGGFEIAAMVGTILEAHELSLPILIDGFIATAAAAIALAMQPTAHRVCFFAHCSAERAHRDLLKRLGANPLLDLGMRLGEGTGAALAMNLLDAAALILSEMASFESAGVSNNS